MKDVSEFIESLLEDICLDDRIPDGTFEITNNDHLGLLREYLTEKVDVEFANTLMETLTVVEGNFPERQAYNKDGILVTFPDAESKKAALDRKTHTENDPTGGESSSDDSAESDPEPEGSNDSMSDDLEGNDDAADDVEPDSIFTDYITPEDEFDSIDPDASTEYSDFVVTPVKSQDDVKEVHHVYDVLSAIKKSQLDDDSEERTPHEMVMSGELHPSILFALKQKWEYDKSGKWFDEIGKFKAHTDKHGRLDPTRPEVKDEMELWLEDYLKRNPDAKI